MKFDPNDPESIIDYVTSEEGRYRRIMGIIAILKAAYEVFPDHFGVVHNLAVHCSKARDEVNNDLLAEEAFERAIALHPASYTNFNEYRRFLGKLGRFEEAENLCLEWLSGCKDGFNQAICLKALAWTYLDWAHDAKDENTREMRYAWARSAAKEAYRIAPEDERIRIRLEMTESHSLMVHDEQDDLALQSRFDALTPEPAEEGLFIAAA